MFKNYLKIALRNLLKHSGYSVINIVGLATGMACCLLILVYVTDELSFDKHHEKADRIYRVTLEKFEASSGTSRGWAAISPGYGPKLQSQFPAIEQATRLWLWSNPVITYGDKRFVEQGFAFAEASVFEIFTIPFVSGDPATALIEPNTVVLSESVVRKYFGNANPLGKTFTYNDYGASENFTVTGVIKDVPRNSHFRFDFLASFANLEKIYGKENMDFMAGSFNFPTYILLSKGARISELVEQFPDFLDHNIADIDGRKPHDVFMIHLQSLPGIYLHSDLNVEYGPTGDINQVYVFSIIAVLVLLIACVNFINLATARSARRAREVGLRKVLGAHRLQLIKQFLGESMLITSFSMLLALALVEFSLPFFNDFTGKNLHLVFSIQSLLVPALLVILLFAGLAAGIYPALFLSRLQPVRALQGGKETKPETSFFRSGLVVLQFAVSIALIVSVGVVAEQLNYVKNKRLGFEKGQVVSMPASTEMIRDLGAIKYDLKQHPEVVGVTASSRVPSEFLNDALEARTFPSGKAQTVDFRLPFVRVGHDFFKTYRMQIVAGRDFSRQFRTDSTEAFILNEMAASALGWASPKDAIGQEFSYGEGEGRIIGVVKDFHFESLHQQIKPMVFYLSPFLRRISVRIRAGDIPETLVFLQDRWQSYRLDYPFSYFFVDDRFDQRYAKDEKLGQLFGVFSSLAIFVACLGLMGLASFVTEQRTKEIGVRKVLGASVKGVVALLSKDFVRLVLLANLFAWPVAWVAMNRWLQDFAYRIDISWWVFVLAGGLALVIALVTVSTQAIRAALANPVEALKYE